MINTILTASGIPYRQGHYFDPPATTYAIYFDAQEADGPDPVNAAGLPLIVSHSVSVELYEPEQEPAAEAAIEAELNARGIPWTKEARYWLQNVQRYQVIYEFSYIEKRRA